MNILFKTLCIGALSVALAACASNDIRWTEEVKLSDGRIIQLERHVELTESGFPVQSRGFNKYHEICFPPMNIHWKSKGGYQPDIFDIVDGKAYMHVPISDCFSCEHHGYPETNALYFVWESGTWKQITHEEFPAASEWNLEMSFKAAVGHEKDDAHGLVTLKDKEHPSSLRTDQQRHGWKRVSESSLWKGRCNACRGVKNIIYGDKKNFLEIFAGDSQTTCR
jgi:hypothetical protein